MAAFCNNIAAVNDLIDVGANSVALDANGFSPISYAIIADADEEIIDSLQANAEEAVNQCYNLKKSKDKLSHIELLYKGYSVSIYPLHHSIYKQDIPEFTNILNEAIKQNRLTETLNKEDGNGATPLHIAVLVENIQIINILLERGANLLKTDSNGLLPYNYATEINIKDLIKTKTDEFIDISGKIHNIGLYSKRLFSENITKNLNTYERVNHPVHKAIRDGKIADFNEHIKKAQEMDCLMDILNSKDNMGATPLHIAAYKGDKIIIKKLLELGANSVAKDKYNFIPQAYMYLGKKKTNEISTLFNDNMSQVLKSHYSTLAGDDMIR